MKLLIKNNEEDIPTSYITTVDKDLHTLLQESKIVKTSDGRKLISLPYIFEQIDSSQTYIVRPFKKNITKDVYYEELTRPFRKEKR